MAILPLNYEMTKNGHFRHLKLISFLYYLSVEKGAFYMDPMQCGEVVNSIKYAL